jgi:hypothetical protein
MEEKLTKTHLSDIMESLGGANGSQKLIAEETLRIGSLLINKNKAYGNSALSPVRIFSRANSMEQLAVRIDDKLSRLSKGHEYIGDDTLDDLVGYLVLLLVARKRNNAQEESTEE